ncbi:unnamed protein product [Caenorhabditis auriculariae]|uniref:IF rod domain-containing protein n=1 Tax=Caenorhabditis auriculariae TaxID=2777116 RepID=A0A8S1H058_9PELO|nr:unnamed protein product [Caenorhabditis auriculariae]
MTKSSTAGPAGEKPLCTLFITFCDLDYPDRDVTTAHVFSTKQQRQYPQTRRTVYTRQISTRAKPQMSLVSPPYTDEDIYDRPRLGSTANTKTSSTVSSPSRYYDNHIVQEVSLSYSAPYTTVTKPSEPLAVQISNGNGVADYNRVYGDQANFAAYYSDLNQQRLNQKKYSPKKLESFERVYPSGRSETEFPGQQNYSYLVKRYGTEEIPYFSAHSAVQSTRNTPIHTPRSLVETPTVRVPSAVSHSTVLSESTTIEELTTITTTNIRSTRSDRTSEMPTVNALAEQFEATARQEKKEALRSKTSPKQPSSRNVFISRPNQNSPNYNQRVRHIEKPYYSPSDQRGIVTTTIVDIEPPGYGRRARVEQYRIEEEYRSKTTYGRPASQQSQTTQASEQSRTREEEVEIFVRSHSRTGKKAPESPPVSPQVSPTVRNVIDIFERREDQKINIENKENVPRRPSLTQSRTMIATQEVTEQQIYIPKRELDDIGSYGQSWRSRPAAVPPPIPITPSPTPTPTPSQPEFIRTYEEERRVVTRRDGSSGVESRISVSQPPPMTVHAPREEPETPTPTPTPRETQKEEEILVTRSDFKTDTLLTELFKKEEKPFVAPEPVKPKEEEREEELRTETTDTTTVSTFAERDYRLRTYEEMLSTSRRRDRSAPAPYNRYEYQSVQDMPTYNSSSSYHRSSSSGLKKTMSDVQLDSYEVQRSGVSGLSGGICTVAIRENREREKREIGVLNDRLASYIEKVRFLEAQNRVLNHDIEILRRGFSADNNQVGFLFQSEIEAAQRAVSETAAARERFGKDVSHLTTEVTSIKTKWLETLNLRKGARGDLDADLEKLAHIEGEISLVSRRIKIIEEECIRIKRDNQKIYSDIAHVKAQRDQEISLRNEYQLRVQDILARVKHFTSENETKIQQELIYIRRDTTEDNREYFRRELEAAIRDIRIEYEQLCRTTRDDLTRFYTRQVQDIYQQSSRTTVDQSYGRQELVTIRTTLSELRTRLAELESRNLLLESQIAALTFESKEDSQIFEAALAEKDALIKKMTAQCTELTVEMEKLCDQQISLHIEIARYRKLIEGANVTTYSVKAYTPSSSNVQHSVHYSSTSSSNVAGNVGGYVSRTSSGHVGGFVGGSSGLSVGGHIGLGGNTYSVGGHIGGGTAVTKKPDRIHDEEEVNDRQQSLKRWYKGTIRVTDVTPEFIELENICVIRRVDVGGFKVVYKVNDVELGATTIFGSLVLDPKQKLRIYAQDVNPAAEFTMSVEYFDCSPNMRTLVYNEEREERAWFVYV